MPAAVLAAEIWHWWIAIVLFAVSILAVLGLVVGYLKNITATRYPNRRRARRQLNARRRSQLLPLRVPSRSDAGHLRLLGRSRFHRPAGAGRGGRPRGGRRPRRSRAATDVARPRPTRPSPLGAALGVAVRVVTATVADGPNLEARARTARRAALPPGSLTGHTADDRAETVLINLLRGAGLDGLAAMGPDPTRPLLGLRRRETAALCAHLGLVPVDDASNRDRRFVRNRVRHELLPLLDDIAGRDTVPLLVRTADLAADDLALAASTGAALDPCDARALAAAPPAAARRALRRWLAVDGYPPDAASISRVLEVAAGTQAGLRAGRRAADRTSPPAATHRRARGGSVGGRYGMTPAEGRS